MKASLFFFLLNKIIIIVLQPSTRYLISEVNFFSSDNEAEQCPTRVDGQDVIGCSAFLGFCLFLVVTNIPQLMVLNSRWPKKKKKLNLDLKGVSLVFFVYIIYLLQ